MKSVATAVVALCALAACASAAVVHSKVLADKAVLVKQKNILQLLEHVHQPNLHLEQKSIGEQWDLESHMDSYSDPKVVKHYVHLWKKHLLLPRGVIFSLLDDKHVEHAIALFDLFYFAKDFDTFYKTACWARDRVNEGVFVYAMYVTVLHRDDTQHMTLPPVFEVMPHFFVDARTIQKAYEARMQGVSVSSQETRTVIIPTNYSRPHYMKGNTEYLLTPLTEDVGLNSYITYFRLLHPLWMSTQKYGKSVDRFGELLYHVHQQILARYNLWRLAAGLPEVDYLTFTEPIEHGYSSQLHYPSGEEMPARPDDWLLQDNWHLDRVKVKDYEQRIRNAIDVGYVVAKDGTKVPIYNEKGMEVLSHVVAGTKDSVNPKYYGAVYKRLRRLISVATDPWHEHGVAPAVAAHHATALRDPAFYQAAARVDFLFEEYKAGLDRYTMDQLAFPGLRIDNVEVDKLITYFDDFDVDLSNALNVNSWEDGQRMRVVARMQRLNHKPFSLKVNLNSDKEANVMVRVFLGPKYDVAGDEMDLDEMRRFMVEIDRFPHKVVAGQNTITRHSHESTVAMKEHSSSWELQRKVNKALVDHEEMYIDQVSQHCGFPQRLMLPKVHKSSMPFVVFVMVTPYEGPMEVPQAFASCGAGLNTKYPDAYPMGYPFDRPINEWEFYTPNMHFKDVLIFHKKKGDLTINVY